MRQRRVGGILNGLNPSTIADKSNKKGNSQVFTSLKLIFIISALEIRKDRSKSNIKITSW